MHHEQHRANGEPQWPAGLAEGLYERLNAASDTESLIDGTDARTIAACLSQYLNAPAGGALRRYADSGDLDAPAIRIDCLQSRATGLLTPQLRRWAAWLTTYAARALPPGQGGYDIPASGDALDAFLALPDITPDSDEIFDQFTQTYCGSYADLDAVLDGVTDILDWERQIRTAAEKLGIAEFVSIDREAVLARVREGWDIIPSHGWLHVFAR